MSSALEKLIALSGPAMEAAPDVPDPAAEMVLAALALADELHAILLASDDDEDDDSGSQDSDDDEDEGQGDELAAMVKKLVAKGIPLARAKTMAQQAMKRVKAAGLAEGISVALSTLAVPPGVTLAAVRSRMKAASQTWQPERIGLTPVQPDEQLIRLAVLTTAQRKKPSAHTIPGSDDYPIPDKVHLTAAIARYKQGAFAGHSKEEVAAHIRSSARRLGEPVPDLS